jgi:hypothetical protein
MPRFRFSLRSFFLVLFIGCLIGSNLFTASENRRLRRANEELQTELGLLVVGDPNKLHAIAVETHEELTWRWRLHVPKGRTFLVGVSTHEIPGSGLAANFGSFGLPEGDFTVTAAIRRDHLDKWRLNFTMPSGSISTTVPDERSKWIVDSPGASSEQAGSGGTPKVVDAGEPMVLLRRRLAQQLANGSTRIGRESCDGVMIWIEEENPTP